MLIISALPKSCDIPDTINSAYIYSTTIFFCRNHPKALQLLTFIVVFNVVHFREYVTGGKMRENASFRLRNGPKYKDIILR